MKMKRIKGYFLFKHLIEALFNDVLNNGKMMFMKGYVVPAAEASEEMVVNRSRFIAAISPAFSVEEAKQFISLIRSRYAQATHHVPAYVIGAGDSIIAHCSDDGEPSGTAGKPILAVLQGSGLGDTVLVVTRYFGGIKLGSGGLVRAYSEAARLVIEKVPRARRLPAAVFSLTMPYNVFEMVIALVQQYNGVLEEKQFHEKVAITAKLPDENFEPFVRELREKSAAALTPQVLKRELTLVPIKEGHA